MGNSNATPAAQAGMTTAEARAAVHARREALAPRRAQASGVLG